MRPSPALPHTTNLALDLSKPGSGHLDGLRVAIEADERASVPQRGFPCRARAAARVQHMGPRAHNRLHDVERGGQVLLPPVMNLSFRSLTNARWEIVCARRFPCVKR